MLEAIRPTVGSGAGSVLRSEERLHDESADRRWKALYRFAGIGALLTALLIPLQVLAFIVWPPPAAADVADWFALFNLDPLVGLVSFDLVILVEEVLLIPIVLALYLLLRRESESLMLMAAAAWLISASLFVTSNTGFEMLSLSHSYAAATTDAQRETFLSAGQAMLSSYMGQGSAFVVGYVLASLAGVAVGIAMLRNEVFHRVAAYAAIAANLVGFGLFVPVIGVPLAILSVALLIPWYALIGWQFVSSSRSRM